MKKFIAIVLALLTVLGCGVMAFAEDTYTCDRCKKEFTDKATYDDHVRTCYVCPYCNQDQGSATEYNKHTCKQQETGTVNEITCPYCGVEIAEKSYNAHIEICYAQQSDKVNFGDVTISNLFTRFIEVFDINAAWWDAIEGIIVKIIDVAENAFTLFMERVTDKVATAE